MNIFTPPLEAKVWGQVAHIWSSKQSATSYLQVNSGFRCSRHFHQMRDNFFYVIDGTIVVEVWKEPVDVDPEYSPSMVFLLKAHQSLTVPAGFWHRFRVYDSGTLIEVYSPSDADSVVRPDDIHRYDVGGQDNLDELKALLLDRELIAA